MDLLFRFKKDYFNYLISIIIPALINAVSIPLFKRMLGAEGYGNFSITFNSLLLFAALLSSWIMQSIIRYSPTVQDRRSFVKKSLLLSFITQALFFLPVVFLVYSFKGDWLLAIFFGASLIIVSVQYAILSVSQSFFLSGKNIFSEFIRSVSYISVGLLLLTATGFNYIYSLFAGIFVSFFLSAVYLFVQTRKVLAVQKTTVADSAPLKQMFKSFLFYGGPISFFFVVNYLITLIDKYFILHALGTNELGNYQAMFDFLSKSIMLLSSPVVISLFPLITVAHQSKKDGEIKKLLIRIIAIELVILIAALILYWLFGAAILSALIKVPDTLEYKVMGMLVIAGAFLWQMALVVHKAHELNFRSWFLLGMITIAFLGQLLIYLIFYKTSGKLLYPAGYVASAIIYLALVSVKQIKPLIKQGKFFK